MLARSFAVALLLAGCGSAAPLTPTVAPLSPAPARARTAAPRTAPHKRHVARLGPPFRPTNGYVPGLVPATNGVRHIPFDAAATAYAATP